ncbi:universal stress protein [Pseudomarimonas arenosa]|uniref:Universal stress protein n=1 Tax=Pseudomarimonas arenosa TaxID=2774145 RepID=A0AAW3ZLS6_9GAMM|nr:universal stress protein [Pseudomarimonas arenosa]MBD8526415.1 universal stress protein [Pseudomarimonas arenosa]
MTSELIHAEGQVIAAVDSSIYAASIAEHAAWAASRLGARLSFLHCIERIATSMPMDLSGNLVLGSQEQLLTSMAELDEKQGKLAQQRGRLLLDQVVERARAQHSVHPHTLLRHGDLLESLLELEQQSRLLVLGKRGEHADFGKGHLGSKLERVIRAVHRPVLVASRAFRPIRRFMIAFDGSPTTRRCIDMVAASPLLKGLDCLLLTAGDAASDDALRWAEQQLASAGLAASTIKVDGAADTAIPEHVSKREVDLLVMGAYGHSRIRNLIVGSTTTQVLRDCLIPVLLLR